MQNRTHAGDRRTVQIVQARTTRDRIRCNTTQCRTRGSRRRQRRRLKQAPPATPPAPRPRGPVPARTVPLKPSLRSAPGAHKGVPRLQSLPGLIPRRLRRGCSFQAKPCFSPTETQLPVCQSPGPVPIPRKILQQADLNEAASAADANCSRILFLRRLLRICPTLQIGWQLPMIVVIKNSHGCSIRCGNLGRIGICAKDSIHQKSPLVFGGGVFAIPAGT